MSVKNHALCTAFLVLAACGGGGGGGGSSSPAAIVTACEAQLNVPAGLCDCVGKESKDLSAPERKLVIASLEKDEKAAELARNELGLTEITRAGMFMLTATQSCSSVIAE